MLGENEFCYVKQFPAPFYFFFHTDKYRREQIVYAKKLIKDFSHKLGKFMVNLFKETAVLTEKSRKTAKEKGKIEAHIELLKSHLNPYKSLVNWVKKVSESIHATLIEVRKKKWLRFIFCVFYPFCLPFFRVMSKTSPRYTKSC